ncbi:MAG: hypothetical protein ACE5F9_01635 [Phycisphaerae bacterium]
MADRSIQIERVAAQTSDPGFVEIMFARSPGEASRCCSLLEDHGVPARVEAHHEDAEDTGVPVLVPAECLEQAAELLAMRAQDDEEEGDEEETVGDVDDELDELDEPDELDDDDDIDMELDDNCADSDEFMDDDD